MDNVNAKPMMMVDNVRNAKMDSNFIPIALVKSIQFLLMALAVDA